MNVQILQVESAMPDLSARIDTLTLSLVRAFRDLDFELEQWLYEAGNCGPKRSSGQRLGAISQSLDDLRASRKQKKQFASLEDRLASALLARNAMVHGRVANTPCESGEFLHVTMLEHAASGEPLCYRLSIDGIEDAVRSVQQEIEKLSNWRRQRQSTRIDNA